MALAQLLAERLAGEASHFAPYVRNLPVGFDGVPIFYGPQAINALRQYPPVSAQVHGLQRKLDRLHPVCPQTVWANLLQPPT